MSALSDSIDAVTTQLNQIATQYPPLVEAAIAAGSGSGVDTAAVASAATLATAAGNLQTALQGTLPAGDAAI